LDNLITTLKAVAEPTRLRLLALCSQGEFTVSELVQILGQSQPRVSRHLKLLCDAGLLQKLREGSWMFYRFAPDEKAASLADQLLSFIPKDDAMIILDQKRLKEVKAERTKAATDYFRQNAMHWDKIRALHVDAVEVEQTVSDILLENPGEKFLDIGTGTGRMLELIAPHFQAAEGIDQSHEMLAIARDNLDQANIRNCQLRQGDMYQLPFPDQSFDAACLHMVLHFADEPAKVIADAARILKPDGRLLVIDLAPHSLEELRKKYHHRRLGFSDGEIVHWYQRNGLQFKSPVHLPGGQLTVALWLGIKN
jgi:ubiquinone/menaquinone biosynthesis C-methylase UbiE